LFAFIANDVDEIKKGILVNENKKRILFVRLAALSKSKKLDSFPFLTVYKNT